jgi:hypothetical protein
MPRSHTHTYKHSSHTYSQDERDYTHLISTQTQSFFVQEGINILFNFSETDIIASQVVTSVLFTLMRKHEKTIIKQ